MTLPPNLTDEQGLRGVNAVRCRRFIRKNQDKNLIFAQKGSRYTSPEYTLIMYTLRYKTKINKTASMLEMRASVNPVWF